jgi:tyrosyl-tRNA synthetase
MGGSDQWGNIVTGTELIRRKGAGEAFAMTTQLIKKADGTKFGKTESGAVWLDRKRTSPYKFYQFWLNASDSDAANWINIFTLLNQSEIELLKEEHAKAPHLRILQKALGKDITIRSHSEADYNTAIEASNILFGNSTAEAFGSLDEATFLDIFDGVPQFTIAKADLENAINIVDFLVENTNIFPSKSEARKMIVGGGVSINKTKVESETETINLSHLINNKFIIAQKGKKNYFLITVS